MKNTREAIKEALKGCDRSQVAKAIQLSLGSLNNQVAGEKPYYPKGKTQNFLDKVLAFIDEVHSQTGSLKLLEYMAEENSCILIKNPAVNANNSQLLGQISTIVRNFADLIDEIAKANNDQTISRTEGEIIRAHWEVLKRGTETFVLACESGIYEVKK